MEQPYQSPQSNSPSNTPANPNLPNYLWQSIVVTVLCCLPAGIVAIVYAAKVDGLKASGDWAAAAAASKNAKTWTMVSAGVGVVGIIAYLLLVGTAALSGGIQ